MHVYTLLPPPAVYPCRYGPPERRRLHFFSSLNEKNIFPPAFFFLQSRPSGRFSAASAAGKTQKRRLPSSLLLFRAVASLREGIPDQDALSVAGRDDRITGKISAAVQHRIPSVLLHPALRAFRLDLLKFLFGVRLSAAGVDRLDQNFVFVHKAAPFRLFTFSVPQTAAPMQMLSRKAALF